MAQVAYTPAVCSAATHGRIYPNQSIKGAGLPFSACISILVIICVADFVLSAFLSLCSIEFDSINKFKIFSIQLKLYFLICHLVLSLFLFLLTMVTL